MTARLLGLLPPLAWLAMWLLSRSPYAYVLGHEVLGESRFSPPVATLVFASGWLLMVAAMMLPGALAALRRQDRRGVVGGRDRVPAFLAAFSLVWLGFGCAFAFGDLLVHARLEPGHPDVAALLPGLALLVAGLWLLLGRFLAPTGFGSALRRGRHCGPAGFVSGWRHGLRCLWSCWALMLAMAAVGHGNLLVMFLFTLLMSVARSTTSGRARRQGAALRRIDGVVSAPSLGGDI